MSDSPPPSKPPQFSLGALLGATAAIGAILGAVYWLHVHALWLVPATLAVGLIYKGIRFRIQHFIEWGVVILVAEVLLVLAFLPRDSLPLRSPRRETCRDNLSQLAVGIDGYHQAHNRLPARFTQTGKGARGLSWRVTILPHLSFGALFDRFAQNESWKSAKNLPLVDERPSLYSCPSSGSYATESDYLAVGGPDGVWPDDGVVKLADITDGTSHTILIVESHEAAIVWTEPRDLDPKTMPAPNRGNPKAPGISSRHSGGSYAALADGSVRFMSEYIDPDVLKQLNNRHDGRETPEW